MSLIKYNPVDEFDAITQRFNNLFNTFRPALESGLINQEIFAPKADIHEDEKNLYFDVDLPGLKRSDVKISVNDDRYLVIEGERNNERRFENGKEVTEKNKDGNGRSNGHKETPRSLRIERSYGSFMRTFTLPENASPANINAKFEDGVLEIVVPKKEMAKPKHIDVNIR